MKKWTQIFVGALVAVIAVYDVFAIIKGGTEASVSFLLITWSYKFPMLPFSIGVICGHLFWRMRDTKETKNLGK